MDLMIRDLLQVGSGLPPGALHPDPLGAGERINMPGPPGTTRLSTVGDIDINAVNPGAQLGPLVNQIAGDRVRGRRPRLRQDRHDHDAGRRQHVHRRCADGLERPNGHDHRTWHPTRQHRDRPGPRPQPAS